MPGETTYLHAEADIEGTNGDHVVRVARLWCAEAIARLMPDLEQPCDANRRRLTPTIALLPTLDAEVQTMPYSNTAWSTVMSRLAERPASVTLEVFDEESDEPTRARLGIFSDTLDRPWVSLIAEAETNAATPWIDFIATTLDQANPAFGLVTEDVLIQATALDVALNRVYDKSVEDSRRYLRGYGYVTVVPAELADRLGGVRTLARSGAFARVHPLTAGGTVLQATSTLQQFDDTAMHRVFRALAPVLPPGQPQPLPGYEDVRVVYEDAIRHARPPREP